MNQQIICKSVQRGSALAEFLLVNAIIILLLSACNMKKREASAFNPDPAADTISATIPGLIGGIYGSANLNRLMKAGIENSINMRWDEKSGNGTSWSSRWEGCLLSPVTGNIVIRATTNKKVNITLGGVEIINISDKGDRDTAVVRLKKNRRYPLDIKYFHSSSGDSNADSITFLELSWKYGRKEMMIIPESAFFHSEEQLKNWMYLGENYCFPYNPDDTTGHVLDPIRISAPELFSLDFSLPTGGLPVVNGIKTYIVCRADREHPEKSEGLGYTYQHHQDIAIWKGRIYVGWNTCKADEDTWPSREIYSTSANGKDWSKPAEMFPQGVSTPLRMYFYLSPEARMLVIAGLRVSLERLAERDKYGLVVREIKADHTLGKVYTLRKPKMEMKDIPPFYQSAPDPGFVSACNDLLNDRLYLSQQDYGNLLEPENRMKWFDPSLWEGNENLKELASEYGKATCFYTRKDGTIVGVSKRRWVTLSSDGGKTWSQPVRPKSLVTNMGKVWGQETANGKYVLIYNPDLSKRWPLVMLTSSDGITFRNPRSINSELPEKRYEGRAKDTGLSYHRGLSRWNNDGSLNDDALWLVYSLNKEDILICRIPI